MRLNLNRCQQAQEALLNPVKAQCDLRELSTGLQDRTDERPISQSIEEFEGREEVIKADGQLDLFGL